MFIGAIIFGRGASPSLLKPYNISEYEGCELVRIALSNHISSVSRMVKIAIKMVKINSPKLRLIVSFADPQYGHSGGIYKAGNWIYTGTTAGSAEYWYNGKRLHSRQISAKGWNIQQGKIRITHRPSDCIIVKTTGKHRYLMPLTDEMREKIEPLRKPYPANARVVHVVE